MQRNKVAFLASRAETAQEALETLTARYGSVAPEQADVIVALGGDGFTLGRRAKKTCIPCRCARTTRAER